MFNRNDKIGIVACSNGINVKKKEEIKELVIILKNMGFVPILGNNIFADNSIFCGSSIEKAKSLMDFYINNEIKAIFDVSGGDIANEILDFLDYDVIKNNPKPFFGYSDLTTVINALYRKTGAVSYLYQIRNLVSECRETQTKDFYNSLFLGKNDLFDFNYKFIRGNKLKGTVLGGNIRCLLKLAGTEYFPDFQNKVLFLESRSGNEGAMISYLTQLKQMGIFNKISGVILGKFSQMERENIKPKAEELILNVTKDKSFPIVKTSDIGHNKNSKCMIIGKDIYLKDK
ncbi:S66 family peptidase [Anaerofustis stercorihominis]|uniref:S66 family peptidase n=1 Tax=Anaerofustis stercorihominis TaxID=214853 RepID=UPI00214B6774|nr:S66 peptidase family protein [Anaerofustis stercorihominis]MCR2033192.1 LD-carboxypeptidase [Anaerofustis stercorihominis]